MSNHESVLEASAPVTAGLSEYLIARVGDAHVAVPSERVETVLDGRVGADPPVAEEWVGGWFEYRDRLWLAIRIDGRSATRGTPVKRIVVRESDHVRFAIEVDEVFGHACLDGVDEQPLCDGEWIAPASWLRRGTSWDGRPVTCIDVDAVVGRIGSA